MDVRKMFQKYVKKQLKNVSCLKKALQNNMFLGQNTARPSFLNVLFRQKVISLQFYNGGSRAGRPRPTRADKTFRFPLWVGRGRPSGDPPAGQTHRVLSVAAASPSPTRSGMK